MAASTISRVLRQHSDMTCARPPRTLSPKTRLAIKTRKYDRDDTHAAFVSTRSSIPFFRARGGLATGTYQRQFGVVLLNPHGSFFDPPSLEGARGLGRANPDFAGHLEDLLNDLNQAIAA